jgi:hypothetical protein
MRDICKKFASKIDADVDSKIYILNNTKLNINSDLNLTLAQQINSDDINDKEIQVFDNKDKEYTVKFTYKGENKEIKVKETETVGGLTDIIGRYIKKKKNSFFSLYNGNAILADDMDKPINQITKQLDQNDKQMDLIIEDGMEEEEEKDEEDGKRRRSTQKSIRNTSIQGINDKNRNENEVNDVNDENEDLIYRNSKDAGKFLIKIHLILFIQFLMIGVSTWLGFHFEYEQIIIDSNKSMIWSFVIVTLFSFFIASLLFCYNSEKQSGLSFDIFVFIPIIIIYAFLLSNYTKNDYILIQLSLFISDFLGVIIFIFIFRRYKGFGALLFTSGFNTGLMLLFYYKEIFYIKEKSAIITISILSFIFIAYINIFNHVARQKFSDNEIKGAVYHFNYNIFYPALFMLVTFLISAIITAICGIVIAVCLIIIAFCVIALFFQSLR